MILMQLKGKYRTKPGNKSVGPMRTRTGPRCCNDNCASSGRFVSRLARALYASRPKHK